MYLAPSLLRHALPTAPSPQYTPLLHSCSEYLRCYRSNHTLNKIFKYFHPLELSNITRTASTSSGYIKQTDGNWQSQKASTQLFWMELRIFLDIQDLISFSRDKSTETNLNVKWIQGIIYISHRHLQQASLLLSKENTNKTGLGDQPHDTSTGMVRANWLIKQCHALEGLRKGQSLFSKELFFSLFST